MIKSEDGYQPQSEMLINILKTNNRLNDVGYGSIYSYLNSSCSFVKWKHEQYDKPRNEDLMLNVKSSTSFKGSKYNNEYQCYEVYYQHYLHLKPTLILRLILFVIVYWNMTN